MNPNLNPTLWAGGVFAATTVIALIILQPIALWWQGRAAQKNSLAVSNMSQENENDHRWATYALVAVIGMALLFLLLQGTAWAPLTVFGIFAGLPYAYLEKKRAERKTWLTRSGVARGLDEIQALAESHSGPSVLDAHPWLERGLKRNTFFQKLDARLMELVGQGLALRGTKTDLEQIARQLQSEDLFQFLRRGWVQEENGDARRVFLSAADAIAERIHLDAESFALHMMGQTIWLWLGLIAALLAAALLPLGAG